MSYHPRFTAFFYFLIALLQIVFILLAQDELRAFTKVILMPALGLYAYASFRASLPVVSRFGFRILALVLVFSWLGDIFLLYDEGFLPGLGSFFLAQLGYTIIFFRLRNNTADVAPFFTRRLFWAMAFLFFGGAFYRLLFPVLINTPFLAPVGMYTIAITTMGVSTALRSGKTSNASYLSGIMGAILFISSDAMIAISAFLEPFPYHQFWVMLTYTLAQFLLVFAIIKHKPE